MNTEQQITKAIRYIHRKDIPFTYSTIDALINNIPQTFSVSPEEISAYMHTYYGWENTYTEDTALIDHLSKMGKMTDEERKRRLYLNEDEMYHGVRHTKNHEWMCMHCFYTQVEHEEAPLLLRLTLLNANALLHPDIEDAINDEVLDTMREVGEPIQELSCFYCESQISSPDYDVDDSEPFNIDDDSMTDPYTGAFDFDGSH